MYKFERGIKKNMHKLIYKFEKKPLPMKIYICASATNYMLEWYNFICVCVCGAKISLNVIHHRRAASHKDTSMRIRNGNLYSNFLYNSTKRFADFFFLSPRKSSVIIRK